MHIPFPISDFRANRTYRTDRRVGGAVYGRGVVLYKLFTYVNNLYKGGGGV